MNPKMNIRKKAMDSMMTDGSAPLRRKPAPQVEGEGMSENAEQEGYEQFMVTPEEKQMILDMREGKSGEQSAPDMSPGMGDEQEI